MTTPLNLYARLIDVDTFDGTTPVQIQVTRSNLGDKQKPAVAIAMTTPTVDAVATSSMIFAWARGKRRNAAGSIRLGVTFGNAFATAVIAAVGGTSYTGLAKKYMVQMSYNGGATFPILGWLEDVLINRGGPEKGIIIEGPDAAGGFDVAHIDHLSYDGTPLSDILDGIIGAIHVGKDAQTTIKGAFYPDTLSGIVGLDHVIPMPPTATAAAKALLTYYFIADTTYGGFTQAAINADILDDSVNNAVTTVLRAAAGKYNQKDTAPIGARANFHPDVAHQQYKCGYIGTYPKVALVSSLAAGTYEPDQTTTSVFSPTSMTIQPGITQMKAQAYFIGGGSNHGLPDGWKFTGIAVILQNTDSWFTNLQVCCGTTGAEGGGVYYNPHNGAFYPLSQAFDVNCMAYDGTPPEALNVGTNDGVFQWVVDPGRLPTVPQWTKLGTLTATIRQIMVPAVGTVWALADTGQGTTGVFQYPALNSEDNASLGYGGWSQIAHGGNIIAMGGGLNNLYYVDASDTTTLVYQASGKPPVKIPVTIGGVVGIDLLPTLTCIVVRTTAGAAGLYVIDFTHAPTTLIDLGSGLADAYGAVLVNRIQQSDATAINGNTVSLLAGTDQGVYWTAWTPHKSDTWHPATGLTGLADRNVTYVAASPPQTVLGRTFVRMYAAGDSTFFVSNTGGVAFQDFMNAPLTLGPFWSALAAKVDNFPFPANNLGAIGNPADPHALPNGGTGAVLPIDPNSDNPWYLPDGYYWCRRLTGLNDFSYRLVKADSPAPYFGIELQELAEITADDSRGAITAAEQLALAHWRWLSENGHQQPLTITLSDCTYRVQEAALPTLITGDMVSLTDTFSEMGPDGTITTVNDFTAQHFYVLQYDEVKDGPVMKVTLMIGNSMSLVPAPIELLQAIVSGTSYGLSRDKRFRRVR